MSAIFYARCFGHVVLAYGGSYIGGKIILFIFCIGMSAIEKILPFALCNKTRPFAIFFNFIFKMRLAGL